MITKTKNTSILARLFFYLVIIEIVVGGSGRLIEIGPLSFKMIFFGAALIISFFSLRHLKDASIFKIQLYFLITVLCGFIFGAFSSAKTEDIFEDIKPLLFFLMINYFAINIKTLRDVEVVSNIIKWSSLVMAVIYLIIVALLYFGLMNFNTFYETQSEGSEIFFRGEYFFFYKGFLYLGIGFFFCLLSSQKKDKIFSLILFTALCLTLTRGFILAASILIIYYVFFINKKYFIKLLTLVIALAAAIFLIPLLLNTLGDKSDSDLVRFVTFNEVLNSVDYFSFFFGHGFGIGVASRLVHMEVAFLEIFHKQGVLGLVFWFYLLYFVIKNYISIKTVKLKRIGLPFVLSVVFVYMQSFTNPFINNPIGISIIIISLVVLLQLRRYQKINGQVNEL